MSVTQQRERDNHPALRCTGCDHGWIDDETGDVTPCPAHRPTQHARWKAGQYRPTPWDWFEEQRAA